jgi:hypothetical protein
MMDILDRFSQYFFGIFFPCLSLIVAGLLWLGWKRGKASLKWPSTTGEILRSTVEYDDGSHRPKVEYRYSVDGEEYHGDTVTYAGYQADRETAESYVARFPPGSHLTVYYDPHSPAISTLETGNGPVSLMVKAIVVVLILFAAGLAILIWGLP